MAESRDWDPGLAASSTTFRVSSGSGAQLPGVLGPILDSVSVPWGGALVPVPFLKFSGEFRSEPDLRVAVRFPLPLRKRQWNEGKLEQVLENDDFLSHSRKKVVNTGYQRWSLLHRCLGRSCGTGLGGI